MNRFTMFIRDFPPTIGARAHTVYPRGKPMKDMQNKPQPRKRRKWGSVIVRRDADGDPTSLQARYVNPFDPSRKVGRNFGLEYEEEAFRWLDDYMV